MSPSSLPRLELTEDPNKKNDYIIFRNSVKGKVNSKKHTTNQSIKSKNITAKRRTNKKRASKRRKSKKSRKGFLDLLY
jgi:hypothetical protein